MLFNTSLKRGLFISLTCSISFLYILHRGVGKEKDYYYSNTFGLKSISERTPSISAGSNQAQKSPPQGLQAPLAATMTPADTTVSTSGFRRLMRERTERVKRICSAMSVVEKKLKVTYNYHNLRILHERGIVYCPVFKASSSNWRENLFELFPMPEMTRQRIVDKSRGQIDLKEKSVPLQSSKRRYQALANTRPDLKTFVIVRHPFERLVSAFRDKLEHFHNKELEADFYYKIYGKKIVKKFRKAAVEKFGEKYFSAENNFGALLPRKRRTADLPTFWEFVQYVLGGIPPRSLDEHWIPNYLYCSFCKIDYRAIIKHENLAIEEPELKLWMNVTNIPEKHHHVIREKNFTSREITDKYFELLSDEDILKLYEIYELDFKMFDYTYTIRNITLPR